MNCINCYQEIPEGSKFCPHCGAAQSNPAAGEPVNPQPEASAQTETGEQNTQQNSQYEDTPDYNAGYTSDCQNNPYQSSPYQTSPVYQSSYEQEEPVNWVPYLVLSIITMVCCCVPFSIVGIVYSAKINSAVNAGDYEGARRAAKTAKIWIIVSAIVGFIANIILFILFSSGISGSYYYYY